MSIENLQERWANLSETVRSFLSGAKSSRPKDDQNHVMSDEEMIDETLEESFPASDPPGHFSKSYEDKIRHS